MRKQHKDKFIKQYGQEMWNLVNDYIAKGDRSPEATEANKLYARVQTGAEADVFTVYAICEGDRFIYIGSTSSSAKKRWTEHKSLARTLNQIRSIHLYMNEVVDQNGGEYDDYFHTITLEQFDNEDDAKLREIQLIEFYKPPYNTYRGGGSKRGIHRKSNEFI